MSDFTQDNDKSNSNSSRSNFSTSNNPSQESIEDNNSHHVFINLLKIDEVFIYKIPPLKSASGHRAEDWNLAHPLFTGCLKLSQNDTEVLISIYSYIDPKKTSVIDENIKLFGECHIAVKPGENILSYFDAVIDSSRYYVIRLRDPTSSSSNHHHRSTLIGIGFRDREPAFDLKNCLNDYVKFINRMDLAAKLAINSCNNYNTTNGGVDHQQQQQDDDVSTSSCLLEDGDGHNGDYKQASANSSIAGNTTISSWGHINPLKDGEKIRLNINKNKPIIMVNSNKASISLSPEADNASTSHHTSSSSSNSSNSSGSSSKVQLLLRPPPAAGSIVHFQSTASNTISDTRTQQKLSQPSTSQPSTSHLSTSQPSTSHLSTSQPSTLLSTTTIISDSYAVVIEGEEDWSDFTSS